MTGNSGVVHQYVYAAECVQRLIDNAVYVVNIANVGLDCDGFVTEFSDVNTGLFDQPAVDVSGDYACAFTGESHSDCPSHALCGACNQCDFAIERHWNPPFLLVVGRYTRDGIQSLHGHALLR